MDATIVINGKYLDRIADDPDFGRLLVEAIRKGEGSTVQYHDGQAVKVITTHKPRETVMLRIKNGDGDRVDLLGSGGSA